MGALVQGGRVLVPGEGLVETSVRLEGDRIAAVGVDAGPNDRIVDAAGLLVLPGIVDLHGDAFERQLMPRPGVHFPTEVAFADTDRQLISNGITTAYHAVTYSWEPGLRGRDTVVEVIDGLEEARGRLRADSRFHLRFELFNLDVADEVADWMQRGRVDLLAFNEHMAPILRKADRGEPLGTYTGRTGLSETDFLALVRGLEARTEEVQPTVSRLAEIALANNIPMASHDDRSRDERRHYNALGCGIAEFPLTLDAADESKKLGNTAIFGAPNVLRGGSHMKDGGIRAADEVRAGRCTALVSDYYYPSLPQAPFVLAAAGDADLPNAWDLVSKNPARAAGLTDRGEIAAGQRADLLFVAPPESGGRAEVRATFTGGRPVLVSDWI
ncbi:alpha-D-ribose 1-methylphosphonate 5-triphosphate diphosphatase [Nisaea acidiphila]|uniref:Alpha-D-ribose 1-methylphosphonate 5-triphosphate diphosphatase n=1 Tax=Nisaea acidiphila TaxID=1862145 RepID=A0A9J7ANB0_9PROT|nr:alpha-D-ribose 1-methylphosphonate 5-triphosphate diphosphatase [Nisaea acidiphila]UUX48434.1 alpha-D-ribose 1-methylphosphonate 5-triphosphate diphosphatase [Nisaea acidiphila]